MRSNTISTVAYLSFYIISSCLKEQKGHGASRKSNMYIMLSLLRLLILSLGFHNSSLLYTNLPPYLQFIPRQREQSRPVRTPTFWQPLIPNPLQKPTRLHTRLITSNVLEDAHWKRNFSSRNSTIESPDISPRLPFPPDPRPSHICSIHHRIISSDIRTQSLHELFRYLNRCFLDIFWSI